MRTLKLFLMLMLAAGLTCGGDGSIHGPVTGMVFDGEARALRPVLGVPGAARIAGPLLAGLDAASVSPDGKLALAVRAGRTLLYSGAGTVALEGALEGVSRIAWAGPAAAAVAGAGRVQLWRSLDATPELVFTAALDGEVAALAAGAQAVVVAVPGGLYVAGPDAAPRLLAEVDQPVALAVAGRDLFIADRSRGEVLVVRSFESSAGAEVFARVEDVTGIVAASDLLLAAGGSTRTLAAFRLASGETAGEAALEFEPTRLERLSGAVFALNRTGDAGQPLYVVDASRGLAVFFVPSDAISVMEE